MGLKEMCINCYVEKSDTIFIVGNLIITLINYILVLILKMSLPDWNVYLFPPYDHYIYFFCYGFMVGLLVALKDKLDRNYIIPIITGEEVKKLYFWNMRKRMIKSEKEKLRKLYLYLLAH